MISAAFLHSGEEHDNILVGSVDKLVVTIGIDGEEASWSKLLHIVFNVYFNFANENSKGLENRSVRTNDELS